MRLQTLIHLALPLACSLGCGSKAVPPSNNAAMATPTATPTPTDTAAIAPTGAPTSAPTAAPTTAPTTVAVAAPAVMSKANAFGQPKTFAGAIEGQVFDLPATTTALPSSFAGMTPFTSLFSQSWNISSRDFKEGFPGIPQDRVEWFAIHWNGTLTANKAGVFDFKIVSDDGARLFIDDVMIINDDGLHTAKDAIGSCTLNTGAHHFVLDYFQGPKWKIALQVTVKGTGMPEKPLTSTF